MSNYSQTFMFPKFFAESPLTCDEFFFTNLTIGEPAWLACLEEPMEVSNKIIVSNRINCVY